MLLVDVVTFTFGVFLGEIYQQEFNLAVMS